MNARELFSELHHSVGCAKISPPAPGACAGTGSDVGTIRATHPGNLYWAGPASLAIAST